MIGENWINHLIQQNKSETDLTNVIYKIRSNLTFNPTPSISLINQGEVDCAGACFLTKFILKRFFPEMKLRYASIPSQPGKSTQIDPLPPKQTTPLAPFQTDPLIPAQTDPLKRVVKEQLFL